jgi:hypothetical protein
VELPDRLHPVESVKDALKQALRLVYRSLLPGINMKRKKRKTGVIYYTRPAA